MNRRIAIFFMLVLCAAHSHGAEPALFDPVLSPDKKATAQFREEDDRSGIHIKTGDNSFFVGGISIIRPLVWAEDSSGLFAIEHIAHGNCVYFLRIKDGVISKIPLDPDLDNIFAYRVTNIILDKSLTRIAFLVTLEGRRKTDKFNIKYYIDYDHATDSIKNISIQGIPDAEFTKLLKTFNVKQRNK